MANRRMIEYANSYLGWGAKDNANMICQGFVGEDWFALTTVDDTIQDLQVHCIFRFDGTEWREIPGNNGGVYLYNRQEDYGLSTTTYSLTVVNEDVALIAYNTKLLWDDDGGWAHPSPASSRARRVFSSNRRRGVLPIIFQPPGEGSG